MIYKNEFNSTKKIHYKMSIVFYFYIDYCAVKNKND